MTPIPETDQQRIYREAGHWIILAEDRPLTDAEERAFDEWCAADLRHERAYHRMLATWDAVPAASERAARHSNVADNVLPFVAVHTMQTEPAPSRRRTWALGFGAVAALMLALLFVPTILSPPPAASYETALAEQRVVKLPDGSRVTLGPLSRLDIVYTDERRGVTLSGGEAFFEVAHDAARPFFVEAGSSLIRVVGTKFDVNVGGSSVRVAVLEGIVHVTEPRAAAPLQVLRKGQRIEVPIGLTSTVPGAATPPIAPSGPSMVTATTQPPGEWRRGRLTYDNVRLGDLVADLNRYYAPGVRLDDPALADLRVTAFFSQTEVPAFLNSLPDIVPVRATENPNGVVTIGRPTK